MHREIAAMFLKKILQIDDVRKDVEGKLCSHSKPLNLNPRPHFTLLVGPGVNFDLQKETH